MISSKSYINNWSAATTIFISTFLLFGCPREPNSTGINSNGTGNNMQHKDNEIHDIIDGATQFLNTRSIDTSDLLSKVLQDDSKITRLYFYLDGPVMGGDIYVSYDKSAQVYSIDKMGQ